jgi:2-oxoisovalerate dehydrogenase E2 component (dihydrolipoyl transacylase)
MAQVLEFRLPDLGEGLTEAEIVRWLVDVGDVVVVDQPVVEVETAKAMVEVPCPYGGVVTARFGDEGTELPVGAPLITVAVGAADGGTSGAGASGASGAPATGGGAGTGTGPGSAGGAPRGGAESSGNVLVGYGTGAPAARRRRVRPAQLAGPADRVGRTGGEPGGRSNGSGPVVAAPVAERGSAPVEGAVPAGGPAAAVISGAAADSSVSVTAEVPGAGSGTGPVAVISPLVRRLAREHGLDLRRLTGSGPDGLILRTDVEQALRSAPADPSAASATAGAAPVPGTESGAAIGSGARQEERIPLRGVRKVVAEKLSRSRREIPDATCWVDADATELMAARAAMNAAGGPKVPLIALLARICTAALARHPELNSTVDTEAGELVRLPEVHLGFAAQTPRGLVVPVVRDAHRRSAESLGAEFTRLTEAARQGTLAPTELTGGTFTLNNYGVFGVDGSTPIINHPEAAMLGVGRIVPKPWVHQGELAVRQVVQLSLTFDHRVCDGGTAGGFLRYVADCVEQPAVLLRTL